MKVRIAITPPQWPRFKRKPAIEPLDLKGAAEIANLREKYGPGFVFLGGMAMEIDKHMPRNSVIITNIGIPR